MARNTPLFEVYQIGDTIDFTQERLGRVCNVHSDKITVCPHCKRPGMRKPLLLSGKVQFIHVGHRDATRVEPLDACTMWPRTEFKFLFGSDSLHPRFRTPGDEDETVEEIRKVGE